MKFDVYCDESGPELLHSDKPKAQNMVIGSLWLPTERRAEFKGSIRSLRDIHRIGSEFKWRKISPSKLEFYRSLVSWFFEQNLDLRFRAIVVDREKINLNAFHDGDPELGFYKFYYQLLLHWSREQNDYKIFCDHKQNRLPSRLKTLERCLSRANIDSIIQVQSVPSEESLFVQLCDVLTGVTQLRLNGIDSAGDAKQALLGAVEAKLGREIAPTSLAEKKFNVFKISPGGGW